MSASLHACMCAVCMPVTVPGTLGDYEWLGAITWTLGVEPWSSSGTVSALNWEAISPACLIYVFNGFCCWCHP